MRLLLLGATGGTGRAVLAEAVDAGHDVTVIARDPGRVRAADLSRVHVVPGDVLVPGPWQDAASEHDTLISCLGSTDRKKPTTVYSRGTLNALDAIATDVTGRLVCLSSAGLYVAPDTPMPQKLVTRLIIQRLYRHGYDDMRRMEATLREREVDWTVVRPPMLTDRSRTGSYRTAVNSHLSDPRSIPRADLADYLLATVSDPATRKAVVEIST